MKVKECIFCQISCKEVHSYVIYDDNEVMAFLDIEPLTKGHTLIIPKKHFNDFLDTPNDIVCKIFTLAKNISKVLKKIFNYDAVIIYSINGEKAQDIRHFHLHIYGKDIKENDQEFYKEIKQKDSHNILLDICKEIKQNLDALKI